MLRFFLFCFVLVGCVRVNNAKRNGADKEIIKDLFGNDERRYFDTAGKYGVLNLIDTCIKYIYVIQGIDTLPEYDLTIGQCNIRFIGFHTESDSIRTAMFGVFINDTVPAGFRIRINEIPMLNGFSINIKEKKITKSYAGVLPIETEIIRGFYLKALEDSTFNRYMELHYDKIHPKFKRLFNRHPAVSLVPPK